MSLVDSTGLGAWELDLEGTSAVVRCVCLNVTYSHSGAIYTSPWRVLSIHWKAYCRCIVGNIKAVQGLNGPYRRRRELVGAAWKIEGVDLASAVFFRSHDSYFTTDSHQAIEKCLDMRVVNSSRMMRSHHGHESQILDLIATAVCHCRFQRLLTFPCFFPQSSYSTIP